MSNQATIWKTNKLTQTYLDGIRGAIPLANEQIDLIQRLVRAACPTVKTILDLGCGDGILGQALLDQYPDAHCVFVDFSEPMLDAAKKRLSEYKNCTFIQADYGKLDWQDNFTIHNSQFTIHNSFDVIVSGFSIHHQPDERKKEVYTELYDLLKPGGIFLNLEHVKSRTLWIEQQFDKFFIDALFAYQQKIGSSMTHEEVDKEFYSRPDKAANILAPVDDQCEWLREIGFEHVDCFLKIFELALFGGLKSGTQRYAENRRDSQRKTREKEKIEERKRGE